MSVSERVVLAASPSRPRRPADRPHAAESRKNPIARHLTIDVGGIAAGSALGMALPLVVGVCAGQAALGAVAAGAAFQVGVTAFAGAYRTRLRAMLWTTLAVAVEAVIGAVTGQHLLAFAVAVGLAGLFAGLTVRASAGLTEVGVRGATALIVLSQFPADPATAARYGVAMLAGGLVQVGLVWAHWQWERQPAERRAVARAYRTLAGYATAPAGSARVPDALPDATVLPRAAALLGEAPLGRARPQHAGLRALCAEAEHIRASLVALARLPVPGDGAEAEALRASLARAGHILTAVAAALARPAGRAPAPVPYELVPPDGALDRLRALPGAVPLVLALFDQLRTAATAVGATGQAPSGARPRRSRPTWRALVGPLAESVRDTAIRRHALRLSVSLVVGVLVAEALPVTEPAWLPFTTLLVLRPELTSTFTRGLERFLGTFAGAVAAIGLAAWLRPDPLVLVLLAVAFAWLAYAFLGANFALFTCGVTGFITFLMSFTGLPPATAVLDRCVDTLVGGVIALLAVVVWSAREARGLRGRLAALVGAQTEFAATVLGYCAGQATRQQVLDRLDAARALRVATEAALARLRAEPGAGADRAELAETAEAVVAGSRRLAGASLALWAAAQVSPAGTDHEWQQRQRVLPPLARQVRRTGQALAHRLTRSDVDPAGGPRPWTGDVLPLRVRHRALATALWSADRDATRWLVQGSAELVAGLHATSVALDRSTPAA